jgi:hypothetical protein
MKELKVMQCIDGSVEGSKKYGTLNGLTVPKPGEIF